VPTGFAAHRSRTTRAIVLIAVWLVVLQAFLAGVATAQAGAMAAADPLLGAICHGSDGAGAADTTAPDANKVRHLCCEYCTSAAPVLVPPDAANLAATSLQQVAQPPAFSRFIIVIALGAIRAGPSQAPPASA
jgi:heme A synthase